MKVALDVYASACVSDVETHVLSYLAEHGPTALHVLHRTSKMPMAFVERAIDELSARGVARWSEPRPKMMADWKLETTLNGPKLRVWDAFNGWRDV